MLIAGIAATWGVVIALGKELRALWMRALEQCEASDARKDARIGALEAEARLTVTAKDAELAELRKLLILQYGALSRAEGGKP